MAPFIMQFTERLHCPSALTPALLKYGGDTAVGAMTILSSVMQFSMLPLQGLSAGRAADHQLQLWSKKYRPCEKSVSPASAARPAWLIPPCSGSYPYAGSTAVYFHLYAATQILPSYHHLGAPDLYGHASLLFAVTARLPADLYCPWKCENIRLFWHCSGKCMLFDSADLYPAAFRLQIRSFGGVSWQNRWQIRLRWRRRQRCFSGSIRNWDNSFNHPLIENIVVKKAKGKETKSFVRLVLPVPNDFASSLFLFINLLMLYWFPHSAIVSTLPPQPEAALSHSKPDSPAPFQREDAAFFQAPVPAGCLPESGLFRLPPEF